MFFDLIKGKGKAKNIASRALLLLAAVLFVSAAAAGFGRGAYADDNINAGTDNVGETPADPSAPSSEVSPNEVSYDEIRFSLRIDQTMENNFWPKDRSFGFSISDNGVYAAAVTLNKDNPGETVSFNFTQPGEHEYVVRELDPDGKEINEAVSVNGVTYESPKTVRVSVVENNGVLETRVGNAQTSESAVSFHNRYEASGRLGLYGRVNLQGTQILSDDQYRISIVRTGNDTRTVEVPVGADGSWSYSEVFTSVGESPVYHVSQVMNRVNGIQYDGRIYDVSVTVNDGGRGELTVTPGVNNLIFSNSAKPGSFRILSTDSKSGDKLEGAKFVLYSDVQSGSSTKTVTKNDKTYYDIAEYTSGTDGMVIMTGLAWGAYYLENTGAPAGYDLPSGRHVSFTVDGSHYVPEGEAVDLSVKFSKTKKTLKGADIKFNKVKFVYDGTEHNPVPKVVSGNEILRAGTDYTVSYSGNVDAGEARVTVKGKGDYEGSSRVFKYTISPASITGATVNLEFTQKDYTGNTVTNSISSVKLNDKTLQKDTDYEVTDGSRLSGTSAGTYTVQVKGKGNYTGTASAKWTIKNTSASSGSGTSYNSSYTGTTGKTGTGTQGNSTAGTKTGTGSSTGKNTVSSAGASKTGSASGTASSNSSGTASKKTDRSSDEADTISINKPRSGSSGSDDETVDGGEETDPVENDLQPEEDDPVQPLSEAEPVYEYDEDPSAVTAESADDDGLREVSIEDGDTASESRPRFLALSWMISSVTTLAAYCGWAFIRNKDAFMLMLQSLPAFFHKS